MGSFWKWQWYMFYFTCSWESTSYMISADILLYIDIDSLKGSIEVISNWIVIAKRTGKSTREQVPIEYS